MKGPRILLVVGGGIAAYKACELVRLIRRHGGVVTCVLTEGGAKFVTPLALAALSENPVYTTLWDLKNEVEMGHIQLSRSADLIVVCPATADLMAKMAAGIADDLATTLLLATDKPVMAVPAMNVRMWEHAATVRNVATLRAAGVTVVQPDDGPMACGEFGTGRLPEPPMVWQHIAALLGIDGLADAPEIGLLPVLLADAADADVAHAMPASEDDVSNEQIAEPPPPITHGATPLDAKPLPDAEPDAVADAVSEAAQLDPPRHEPEVLATQPVHVDVLPAAMDDDDSDWTDNETPAPTFVPASTDSLYEALEPEDEPESSGIVFGGLSASLISRKPKKKSALELGDPDPGEMSHDGYANAGFAGSEHGIDGPDFTVGGYAGPEFHDPDYAEAEYTGPNFAGPGFSGPGFSGPGHSDPDFANPDFAGSDYQGPEFAGPDFSSGPFDPAAYDPDAPPPVINLNSPLLSKKGKARSAPPTDPDAINHTVSRHGNAAAPQPFTIGLDAAPLPGAVDPLDGQPDFEKDPPHRPLAGKHVLITAGPTYEAIDPVRYIANRSSGKQGYAIAAAAAAAGARVTLVSGPVILPTPPGVDRIDIESAREMAEAVKRSLPADVGIMVAAVADWRTRDFSGEKIKKRGSAPPALLLMENPDILATLAGDPKRPKLLIGFAAETEKLLEHAMEKRKRKGADWIIANDVSGDVMGGAANCVHIVTSKGVESLPTMPKEDVAFAIVERIIDALAS